MNELLVYTPHVADLYGQLLSERSSSSSATESANTVAPHSMRVDAALRPASFHLTSIHELHFLDWHACALLARQNITPTFDVEVRPPPHLAARLAVRLMAKQIVDEIVEEAIRYTPGAVLACYLSTAHRASVWHEYLTSRDLKTRRVLAGATLENQFPHLRLGFVTGIDCFNSGEYYAAHEEWESLWMRLPEGDERRAAQGLIQLAGAHIHRIKNRAHQARKLYRTAREYLRQAATIEWLDVPTLVETSDAIFEICDATACIIWPFVPLRNSHTNIARKHL